MFFDKKDFKQLPLVIESMIKNFVETKESKKFKKCLNELNKSLYVIQTCNGFVEGIYYQNKNNKDVYTYYSTLDNDTSSTKLLVMNQKNNSFNTELFNYNDF